MLPLAPGAAGARCAGAPSTSGRAAAPPAAPRARRDVLTGMLALAGAAALAAGPAQARPQAPLNKEVPAAESPYIQALLARSRANKAAYDKARLDDYYKRNFADYFEFEAGSAAAGAARGIKSETQQAIADWLEKNK
ncbi:hypothetical protein HT031_004805 [Scenedesmus sp. PABB004]|nr:hypothetical protein HT031_004805 [Scenedesmus sp. PABB004]